MFLPKNALMSFFNSYTFNPDKTNRLPTLVEESVVNWMFLSNAIGTHLLSFQ